MRSTGVEEGEVKKLQSHLYQNESYCSELQQGKLLSQESKRGKKTTVLLARDQQ